MSRPARYAESRANTVHRLTFFAQFLRLYRDGRDYEELRPSVSTHSRWRVCGKRSKGWAEVSV